MSTEFTLPRVLIIDDLFGRVVYDLRNEDRASLCGQFLLEDVTGDEAGNGGGQKIKNPIAQAVFHRGQRPVCAKPKDNVENDLEGALEVLRSGWSRVSPGQQVWSLVLLDLCFYTGRVTESSNRRAPGMPEGRDGDDDPERYFGLRLLEAINKEFPDLPVVILSSMPRKDVSREFAAKGALGFLPREDNRSRDLLRDYLFRHGLLPDTSGCAVGLSKSLLLALRAARRAGPGGGNVLIRGEPGSGKELLARYIHDCSTRSSGPFTSLSLPGIPDTLAEDTLFGHEPGAFTGAKTPRCGVFETANRGTLFLDEVGDASGELQAKLLRVLEKGEVQRLGSDRICKVDLRVVSATNIEIERKAATGAGFRLDLLDRLRSGGTVHLPSLRDRKEDIPMLVERFVREAEAKYPGAITRSIEPDAIDLLCSHDWPGNIRELRNCISEAVQNHPDVEHLVSKHLGLKRTESPLLPVASLSKLSPPTRPVAFKEGQPWGSLNAVAQQIDLKPLSPEHAGRLSEIEGHAATMLACYLSAAARSMLRPSPGNPEGEVLIQPTLRHATGDKQLSASKAADVVKRIHGLARTSEARALWEDDPFLRQLLAKALELRPRAAASERKGVI